MQICITNAQIFDGESFLQDHTVLLSKNQIEKIISGTPKRQSGVQNINLDGHYLVPGFIDLQVNGGDGSFFTTDLSLESLKVLSKANRDRGTLFFLPTVVSTRKEAILKAIDLVRTAMQDPELGILGMHLEGPFLNPEKKGAHNPRFVRKPTTKELEEILSYGKDVIKLITIAPELFTTEQIELIKASGMVIAAGHSMLTYSAAMKQYDSDVKMATHLYNAMSPFQSRAPGLVGATLHHPQAWASIIVDGHHVDFAAVELAYKLKKGRLFLISDAYFVGESRKHFHYDGLDIYFKGDKYVTANGTLAGATIAMLDAVKNCVNNVGIPLEEAIRMASLYPATVLELQDQFGKIKEGYCSELLVLDKSLNLRGRICEGQFQTFH